MKGLHGFRITEIELVGPIEKQATQESAAATHRILEDIEESFGKGAPDTQIRGFRLALSDGAHLRQCAKEPLNKLPFEMRGGIL